MKKMISKFLSINLGIAFAFGLIFMPFNAEAKAFGKDCETTQIEVEQGSCPKTKTVCKQKFLWITVGTEVSYEFDCSAVL